MDRSICWGGSRVGRGGVDRQTTDNRQTTDDRQTDNNLSRSDPPSNVPRDEIGRGSPTTPILYYIILYYIILYYTIPIHT